MESDTGITGTVSWALINADGTVVDEGVTTNKITQVGDQYYGERAAGLASPPSQVTGMRLGTGTTAPQKTGAPAALGAAVSGGKVAIDAGSPTSSLVSTLRRITWVATFPAGTGTTSGTDIGEVVLVNDAISGTTTGTTTTIARALISPTVSKAVDQVPVVTWQHDIGTA